MSGAREDIIDIGTVGADEWSSPSSHLTHLAPGHHSSAHKLHKWLRFAFSVQKASRQQSSAWGVTWHNPDKLKPRRARGRESSWPAITDHKNWRARPLKSKQQHRHRVKQSQLSSRPAVLCLFLPFSSSFDWSWDAAQWAQSAACSTGDPGPGQPDVRAGWGRALSLGSPADLSELRSWQSFVTHRESRGMARRIQPSGSGVLLSHFSPIPLVQCRRASQSEEDEGGGRFSPTWKFAQTGQNLVWCWPPQSSAETSQAFCQGLPSVALVELVGNSRKLNEGNLHKTYRLSHYTRNCPRHSLHRHTICNIR